MQKWPDWSRNQDISFSLRISSHKYQITEIHVGNFNFSLIFWGLSRFSIALLFMRSLVFSKILTNQIKWKRRVKNWQFTTNLVILAQSMQKLQGFIDVKQFNNAVFRQNSWKFHEFSKFYGSWTARPGAMKFCMNKW